MAIRLSRIRSSWNIFGISNRFIKPIQCRLYTAQPSANEQVKEELNAQAELAAKAKVLSPYHKVSFDERKVRIPWQDGKTSSFHHIYLRDHCRCEECFHPITKQRLLNTFKIPPDIKPAQVEPSEEKLQIQWPNGHQSSYPWAWLHRHSYEPKIETDPLIPTFDHVQLEADNRRKMLWGSEIAENPPTVDYNEVMNPDTAHVGVGKWTKNINDQGFSFVENVPHTPGATKELVEQLAYIMPSHYGGFWDFTSDLKHSDTAYTPLPLPAHTDTTYYSQSAGLQLFHCLKQSETGGESLLVDGFKAAQTLREEHPDSYQMLSRTAVPAHSAGDPNFFFQHRSKPVLVHDLVGTGELIQVRWNNDDRSAMGEFPSEGGVEGFYEAMRRWDEILRRKENEYWMQLVPGKVLSIPFLW